MRKNKPFLGVFLAIIMLSSLIGNLPPVSAQVASRKWTVNGPPWYEIGPTGRGVLIANVIGDSREEIIYPGGNGYVDVFDSNGARVRHVSVPGLDWYGQLQMSDIDLDGRLEIIVPVNYAYNDVGVEVIRITEAGFDRLWRVTGAWGELTAAPVVGDVTGDGYPEIFVGTTDIWHEPSSGYQSLVVQLSWTGEILHTARVWRLCAGGLSLADTDSDGRFELYGGDRSQNYDESHNGRGVRSWWADNLQPRWNVTDLACSSNIPMIADVNGDGVGDVIAVNLAGGLGVFNSATGQPIVINGKTLKSFSINVHGHYQQSVADIDADGHLEILMADGEHGYTYVYVWDLVDWKLDFSTNAAGLCMYGPRAADINGDGYLEMIVCANNLVRV